MICSDFVELLDAAHNSIHVNHSLPHRGGIMLCGPPESFKSTLIEVAIEQYPDSLMLSDVNVQGLSRLKADIACGRYRTLAFPEFSKLIERDPRTAAGVIGTVRALADEGFRQFSFDDTRAQGTKARALIIGGMTEDFYQNHFTMWEKSGFMRRFLWLVYRVENISKATEAILKNELLTFNGMDHRIPPKPIAYDVSPTDQKIIHAMMKYQRGNTTPIALLCRMWCYLKWKGQGDTKHARHLFKELMPFLTRDGGVLYL